MTKAKTTFCKISTKSLKFVYIGVILLARTIVAIFELYGNAERAAYEVRDKGLRTDNISIIVKDSGNKAYYRSNNENGQLQMIGNGSIPYKISKGERISDGVVTGGIFGGVIGILIGAASMLIPGLGMIAATGPIGGLLIGLIAGGIVGGLLNFGIPKNKRQEYEKLVSDGNAVFSMKVDEERLESIIEILKKNGALSLEMY